MTDAKWRASAPGVSYRALNTVIEPIVNVTPCSTRASSATSALKRLAKTRVVGCTSARVALMTAPVMWNNGATANTASPAVRPTKEPKVVATASTLAWVFIAPFGGPVVPEV